MQRKGRRSAVSPWNVDLLLRSTTLRRIRSARSGLWQRSFRSSNQKSCHASVAVTLEKRGGCCRTDGPIRVLSCQMWHTIAAIKARGVALCVEAPLRVRSTPPAARSYHSLQQALNPWSRTQRAATDGSSPACCISLMLRLRVMLRVLPSPSSVRSLLVLLLCKQRCLSCLSRGWGTIKNIL